MLSRKLSHSWRILGIAALMVASMVVAAPASANHGGSHSLQLVSIVCLDKDDWPDKDEPYIKVGGTTVWSGQKFAVGTSKSLLTVAPRVFTGSVNIDLWEDDAWPNTDDYLGGYTVQNSEAGLGDLTQTFALSGALYEITYRVN